VSAPDEDAIDEVTSRAYPDLTNGLEVSLVGGLVQPRLDGHVD
jgi:hypothetical protein